MSSLEWKMDASSRLRQIGGDCGRHKQNKLEYEVIPNGLREAKPPVVPWFRTEAWVMVLYPRLGQGASRVLWIQSPGNGMVILTCNLIAGVSGHSQIASFSPRLVSSSRCQRRSQGGSEVPHFSSQEAKPEAGSVVTSWKTGSQT